MNKVIEIPKELSKNQDLIIIPRSDYEELLTLKKFIPLIDLSSSEKKALEKSRKEIKKGNYVTLDQLKNEMGY